VLSRQCSRRLSHYIMKILCTQVHPEEVLLACCETVKTDRTVDIKPDNLLVKNGPQDAHYKVCDLGNSASLNVLSNDKGHLIGAEIFCAPEVPLGVPWTTKADIWAAGATGITLVTGHYIFLLRNAPPSGDLNCLWEFYKCRTITMDLSVGSHSKVSLITRSFCHYYNNSKKTTDSSPCRLFLEV